MWKSRLLAFLLLPAFAGAVGPSMNDTDSFVRSRAKPKEVDRQVWKREVTASISMIETLRNQLKDASPAEAADIWLSGSRDFNLPKSVAEKTRDAAEYLSKIAAAQGASQTAKTEDLMQDARDKIKGFHKGAKAEFLTEYRNWLTVSEGTLRKTRLKEAKAKAAKP